MSSANYLFKETQRVNQTLAVWLLLLINGSTLGPLIFGIVQQVGQGEPWGDDPMSNPELMVFTAFMIVVLGILNFIFIASRLEIVVTKDSISYRLFPLVRKWKQIPRSQIQSWEVRKFHRIKDFGGYGIHFGFMKRPKSLSVWGNFGIKLIFGRKDAILVGTQRPEALKLAMTKMMEEE